MGQSKWSFNYLEVLENNSGIDRNETSGRFQCVVQFGVVLLKEFSASQLSQSSPFVEIIIYFSKILQLGFDESFIRTWEYYFDNNAAGIKSRTLANYQIVYSRPGNICCSIQFQSSSQ
ncbi:unnamed protein product [Citrullus colocynthis]|uniref:Uncharacterized protein n=1 Tax=Citrullus colocynthis TaxID=252529 RepID=A0ABP0Z8W7_9ROSI